MVWGLEPLDVLLPPAWPRRAYKVGVRNVRFEVRAGAELESTTGFMMQIIRSKKVLDPTYTCEASDSMFILDR